MNRRLFIGTLAAGGIGAAAGCLSGLVDDATTFSAVPARVSEAAAADAGYDYRGTRERVDSERVAGRDVEIRSYASTYDRAIDLPGTGSEPVRAGVFGVGTTPTVAVDGESFDPLGGLSDRDLVGRVQDRYDGLEIDRAVGGRALEALGERFSLTSYEGTASLDGADDVAVLVDVAAPDHEADRVVVAAVYPTGDGHPGESERPRIDALVRGLEHHEDIGVELVEGGSGG
jgi:hypothetical protein